MRNSARCLARKSAVEFLVALQTAVRLYLIIGISSGKASHKTSSLISTALWFPFVINEITLSLCQVFYHS